MREVEYSEAKRRSANGLSGSAETTVVMSPFAERKTTMNLPGNGPACEWAGGDYRGHSRWPFRTRQLPSANCD